MNLLKSTTSLVMCCSLGLPSVSVAQAQTNEANVEAFCTAEPSPPCLSEEGNLLLLPTEDIAELLLCEGEDNLPCRTEEGFKLVECTSEEALNIAAEACLSVEEAKDAVNSGEAVETTEAAKIDETVAVEPEAVVEAETTEEAQSAETEEVKTENELSNEEQAAETTPADPVEPSADAVETVESNADAVETKEVVAESGADADVAVGLTTESDAAAKEEPAAVAESEAQTETEISTATETTTELAVDEVVENPEIVAEVEAGVVEIEEASVGAAAASDGAGDGEAVAGVEVEEEEVTEETARASTEDFATSASGGTTASASTGGGGMSKFEKALLLGLGAVVVGSILKNGDEVVSNSGDRLILKSDTGNLRVLKNDDALLRQPGSAVRTETFSDGSTRTSVTKQDGSKIVTIRASDGRVVRRERVFFDGSRVVLFDDLEVSEPVDISTLPEITNRPRERMMDFNDEEALRLALAADLQRDVNRSYSLRQIRQIRKLRELAPEIELDAITFRSGSAAIDPSQARELATLGRAMARAIEDRPGEVFLIEGHTDAVGAASYNLALSDRRAETVALALSEFFDVPPENLITQGYGESYLKIPTLGDEQANRRATVRRITPLLHQVASNR